jgi:hypothetical protein
MSNENSGVYIMIIDEIEYSVEDIANSTEDVRKILIGRLIDQMHHDLCMVQVNHDNRMTAIHLGLPIR